MNDRYAEIKRRLLAAADSDSGTRAIVAIGSSTRRDVKADEFSDLDLIIAAEDTESWLCGDMPHRLGDVKISFVEPTLGGGMERRVLYDNALDVDMIVFSPEQFASVIKEGVAGWVCNRGYTVMHDTMGCEDMLAEYVRSEVTHDPMTEEEYINMVNDFCFHVVWTSKKILRGELWSAKMCIDAYLKNYLLKMIELYSVSRYSVDVWHDGRFIDRWADDNVKEALPKCFARYNREDIISALFETEKLFAFLAESAAELKGYHFPETAVRYAEHMLSEYFS